VVLNCPQSERRFDFMASFTEYLKANQLSLGSVRISEKKYFDYFPENNVKRFSPDEKIFLLQGLEIPEPLICYF